MADMRLGIVVDTDTRATKHEFSALRREVKREAEGMGDDWEAAAQKVEDALREAGARDDLLEAARKIGTEGPNEIEKMRQALKDGGDQATDTASEVERAARDIRDAVEDNAITADDIYGAEMRAELTQNFAESGAEVVRGFKDGFDSEDIETITDGLTDTLVSLGAAAGPAGTAGALLASTIIQSFVGEWQERRERIKEVAAEVREILVENSTGAFDQLPEEARAAFQQVNAEALLTKHGLEDIDTAANALGVTSSEVLAAMAGDTEAAREVQEAYKKKVDEVTEATKRVGGTTGEAMAGIDGAVGIVVAEMGSLKDGISQAEREYQVLEGAGRQFESSGTTGARKVKEAIDTIRSKDVTIGVYADTSPAERSVALLRQSLGAPVGVPYSPQVIGVEYP